MPVGTAMNKSDNACFSIVMPAYNEGLGIQKSIRTLAEIFDGLRLDYEIIVVDDGSRDRTFDQAAAMADAGFKVRAIRLSRNFGKEAALLAGLQNCSGDAVITIDADLQHPPALIPSMIEAWRRGAKVVHAVKRDRGDESFLATWRASIVNALLTTMGGIDVRNSSDFKLLDRAAVDVLAKRLPENRRFYRGLADWIGFSQVTLEFDVAARETGQSGFSLNSLISLALTAIVSFTSVPLRIVSVMGILTFLLGLGVGVEALISWARGVAVSGFLTTIMTLLLIGSFIMISLGVIGEYIAKIYDEIKQRPTYIVDRMHECAALSSSTPSLVPVHLAPEQFQPSP
jgi:glycosyltransferase involved in cell wall biosynthesis